MGPIILFAKSGNPTQKGLVYPLTLILRNIFILHIDSLHSQMKNSSTQGLSTAPLYLISQKLGNFHSLMGKSSLASFLSTVVPSGVQEDCFTRDPISQSNLEKEKRSQRYHTPRFQPILQSCHNQNATVLE